MCILFITMRSSDARAIHNMCGRSGRVVVEGANKLKNAFMIFFGNAYVYPSI